MNKVWKLCFNYHPQVFQFHGPVETLGFQPRAKPNHAKPVNRFLTSVPNGFFVYNVFISEYTSVNF